MRWWIRRPDAKLVCSVRIVACAVDVRPPFAVAVRAIWHDAELVPHVVLQS